MSALKVANEFSVLRHMLRLAERWGYLDKVPGIDIPKKREGWRTYLSPDEIGQLMTACTKSKNTHLPAIVTVALNTGMRKREIMGLEWSRMDLTRGLLTVYKTKSGKPRSIRMTGDVYNVLVALEPAQERRDGRLFKRRNGPACGQVRPAFMGALKRAQIEGFRFHDLRHTFANHFVMREGSLMDLQEILGHADYKMTLRYAHLSPKHLQRTMERMEGLTAATKTPVPVPEEVQV